jgi:murein DD-endopeptidase MepM/ murein hydrolase activator NlpD
MKRSAAVVLFLLAAAAAVFIPGHEASAANPIKLFAPWEPGYKWDTGSGNPWGPGHYAIDFNGVYDINGNPIGDDNGKPVLASQDGTVTVAGGSRTHPCGYYVYVHHGNDVYTRYCHLQEGSFAVSAGSRVLHGMKLGNNGCTGECTHPHIHFELSTGGPGVNLEFPSPLDGQIMIAGQNQLFLSHNFVERLEIGYRDSDFDDDLWPDVGGYYPQLGDWWVALNTGSNTFVDDGQWRTNWGRDSIPGDWRHLTGDFDNDGDTDIARYNKKLGQWRVARSNGSSGFTDAGIWRDDWAKETANDQWRPFTGDFAGPEISVDDVGVYSARLGRWFIADNQGNYFDKLTRPGGAAWLDEWANEAYPAAWRTH